jgi:hypothetical protein
LTVAGHRLRAALVVAALPLAGLAAGPVQAGPAGASTTVAGHLGCADLGAVRQQVAQGFSLRTARLRLLASVVTGSAYLTAADRATLRAELADETAGLTVLGQKVTGASSCSQLKTDRRSMIEDYRVGSVLSPQVDLVVLADRLSSLAATLSGYEPALHRSVTAAAGRGAAAATAQATLADYATQVESATHDLSGLSRTLLAQSPAGYPANRAVFTGALALERSARAAIKTATADGHRILAELEPVTTSSG